METKKEAFKKFVIEQLEDFDYWGEASPEGYAEAIVDEAVKLFAIPAVVGQSEQLTCECVGLGSTECNKINDKWICCRCNRPLVG